MEEKFVKINGLKIFTRIDGQGSPFLILHGWGASTESWIKVSDELKKYFSVICFDFPGFGKSDLPDSAWDINNYVDFVVALTEKLELEKFYLLAHSFGGRVAIKLAGRHPKKIEKLIMMDAAGIKPERPGWFKSFLNGFMANFKFLPGFKIGRKAYYKFVVRSADYLKATGIMKEVFKKVVEEDLSDCLDKIKTETLIIWGEADKVVPLEDGRLMNEKIAGSRLEIVKAGHSPHLIIPKIISKKIINFIYGSR